MSARQAVGRGMQFRKYWSDYPDLMISLSICAASFVLWPFAYGSIRSRKDTLHMYRNEYTVIRPEDVDPKKPTEVYN